MCCARLPWEIRLHEMHNSSFVPTFRVGSGRQQKIYGTRTRASSPVTSSARAAVEKFNNRSQATTRERNKNNWRKTARQSSSRTSRYDLCLVGNTRPTPRCSCDVSVAILPAISPVCMIHPSRFTTLLTLGLPTSKDVQSIYGYAMLGTFSRKFCHLCKFEWQFYLPFGTRFSEKVNTSLKSHERIFIFALWTVMTNRILKIIIPFLFQKSRTI